MGKSPFPGKTYNEVLAQNRACNINFDTEDCQKLPAVSTTISYSALSLLKSMLDRNPQTRITAKDALQHPFLNNHTDYSGNSMKEELTMPNTATSMKQPLNKTSIMVNGACNSPLMTSCNPLRKNPEMLKDDSCLKFKMKESILTGKTEEYESGAIDSPAMKKNMQLGNNHKESRFGQEKRLLAGRDMNAEN
jgi:serine/threonine protein kinase